MDELRKRLRELVLEQAALENNTTLSPAVKKALLEDVNKELRECDNMMKRSLQDERMERARAISDEAKEDAERYKVSREVSGNFDEIFREKLSKLEELNDPIVNEGLAFREKMCDNNPGDMSLYGELQNYVDAQYRKYFREEAKELEAKTAALQNAYESTVIGTNNGSTITLDGIANGTVDDGLAMQAMVESANRNNNVGDRPVTADPNNPENASVGQNNSGTVEITPEVAGQEIVEPSAEAEQSGVSQSDAASTLVDKSKPYIDKVADKGRKLVTKISSNVTIGKAAIVAAIGVGAALFAPLVAPVIGTVLSTAGSVAVVGGVGAASYEFMKGRKL